MTSPGAAGIGKTTVWRTALDWARNAGFVVLTAAGAAAEVSLALAALADLLAGIDPEVLTRLSPLHQQALHAVITGTEVPGADERLLATAFRAALDEQARHQPVLIAIDDAHWLDEASRLALGFAIRRLTGPIAVLAAYRSNEPTGTDHTWVTPRDPRALHRLTIGPMTLGALHTVLATHHGHTPPRPTMVRIHTLSGGNPFYALELARALAEHPDADLTTLPPTLTGLLSERIGDLDPATTTAAVTTAAATDPTLELIATATGHTPTELVTLLTPLEHRGLLTYDGHHIRFTHPLIATAITTTTDPTTHRHAHHRLAQTITQPELRARHLALATPHGDPDTLTALDTAATTAAAQGSPATAAELIDLAIKLGGDTEMRRILSAGHHLRAGDTVRAETVVRPVVSSKSPGPVRGMAAALVGAMRIFDNSYVDAAEILRGALADAEGMDALRVRILLPLSFALGMANEFAAGLDYARQAVGLADKLGSDGLISQALAWLVTSECYNGLGVNESALRRALELESDDADIPAPFRASAVESLVLAWTGRLDEASTRMQQVRASRVEYGAETDMVFFTGHSALIDMWRGRIDLASLHAAEAVERADQMGGEHLRIIAWTVQAAALSHAQPDDARKAAETALTAAHRCGSAAMTEWPMKTLGFIETARGNYVEALDALTPLLENFPNVPSTEIMHAWWVPDAVEALAALGRVAEAEPLASALETNGTRLDRPWMLAVAARSRAHILAATGNLDGALAAAETAMTHHDRLPMPFERARTQLLLGQLQRRRRPQLAHTTLTQAATTLDEIGSPLWAARAHRELDRLATRTTGVGLTEAERTVAEHAAAGLSNKQIAATLYLSTKTVEMYLSNTYRKLGIRSRAQLAQQLPSSSHAADETPPATT